MESEDLADEEKSSTGEIKTLSQDGDHLKGKDSESSTRAAGEGTDESLPAQNNTAFNTKDEKHEMKEKGGEEDAMKGEEGGDATEGEGGDAMEEEVERGGRTEDVEGMEVEGKKNSE
eukprot:158792-Amorphochlora_amoeboformis.AAC.1